MILLQLIVTNITTDLALLGNHISRGYNQGLGKGFCDLTVEGVARVLGTADKEAVSFRYLLLVARVLVVFIVCRTFRGGGIGCCGMLYCEQKTIYYVYSLLYIPTYAHMSNLENSQ